MSSNEHIEGEILFESENHKFIWLGADSKQKAGVIQTNQYLIINNGKGILLDPGGVHLFSRVVSVASRFIDLEHIEAIFFSHQDPDVSSGIALWLGVTPARIYVSGLWLRFLPHFGVIDQERIEAIEDDGGEMTIGSGAKLKFIPSHFLHSTGNFSLYDETSGILFSGDIGAAAFKEGEQYLYVEDFDTHLSRMEGFHKRYMTNNRACKDWVNRVSKYSVSMVAPQHGAVLKEDQVQKFFSWMKDLQCGTDLLDSLS